MRRLVVALSVLAAAVFIAASPAVSATPGKFDVGTAADVAAVRKTAQADHEIRAYGVHVFHDYALTHVLIGKYASGMWVYKRLSGENWKRIIGGGGAIDTGIMTQDGVPASIAKQLCSGWPKGYGC